MKNCLLVMQTVLYSLFVNIHRVVFLISKCLKCYQLGRKIYIKGGMVVGGGSAGINKSHNSFQSLEAFFSLLSHVRFKHGRWGQDVYFASGVFANCRFYTLPLLFSVYVRYFKNRKKSSPSTSCISFFCSFFFFYFPPPPSFSPLSCAPLPALFCARIVLHVPLGRLRKSRCC